VLESPPTLALYLLGNIQTGKSEKKTQIPRMGPGLEEHLLSQASTYVRNIQTGKSKKLFLSVGNGKGQKGEKILVPVRFSRSRQGERGPRGLAPGGLFCHPICTCRGNSAGEQRSMLQHRIREVLNTGKVQIGMGRQIFLTSRRNQSRSVQRCKVQHPFTAHDAKLIAGNLRIPPHVHYSMHAARILD
jgi:hypothetical protein